MAKKDDILPTPEDVITPAEELEVLAELKATVYFTVLKRVARRYVENLKNKSFTLASEDPNLAIKHTRHVEQAVGMQLLIRIIEGASRELAQKEGDIVQND